MMMQFIRFAERDDFTETVQQSLIDILGESSIRAILYHLGGATVIQHPELFVQRLRHIFGIGADVLMTYILNNLKKKKMIV